jgi:hypothetical protein
VSPFRVAAATRRESLLIKSVAGLHAHRPHEVNLLFSILANLQLRRSWQASHTAGGGPSLSLCLALCCHWFQVTSPRVRELESAQTRTDILTFDNIGLLISSRRWCARWLGPRYRRGPAVSDFATAGPIQVQARRPTAVVRTRAMSMGRLLCPHCSAPARRQHCRLVDVSYCAGLSSSRARYGVSAWRLNKLSPLDYAATWPRSLVSRPPPSNPDLSRHRDEAAAWSGPAARR